MNDHQALVLAQVDIFSAQLAMAPELAREGLAKARWNLSRLLRAYQLFKHTEIFDPAIARGDALQIATARRLKANCVAAGQHYAAHVARWSARDVVGQWDQYRPATLAICEDLRAHIARERGHVERFLAGSERTRRLASARTARPMP